MPLQPLPILSGLERGDVVKFVLHLAETVKWGLQRGFCWLGSNCWAVGGLGGRQQNPEPGWGAPYSPLTLPSTSPQA